MSAYVYKGRKQAVLKKVIKNCIKYLQGFFGVIVLTTSNRTTLFKNLLVNT